MLNRFYAGLDVGSSTCELVAIDTSDRQVFASQFSTSEKNLLTCVRQASSKHPGEWAVALEEGELAQWVADVLRPEVARLVVCDPKRNAWIARDPGKNDRVDAAKLAKLLKGGYLTEIFHSNDGSRVEFKRAVKHYHDLTRSQAGIKCQIKARLRAHGLIVRGTEPFLKRQRESLLHQLPAASSRQVLGHLFELLDQTESTQDKARQLMLALSRSFPEVARFQEVPGIGPVWACTFSAYVQTPHRFRSKRQLWRYCGLAITNRQSNGEPLGRQRLDRSGVRHLKGLSFQAFCAAQHAGANEFQQHFAESLARTNDRTHARLSTQRKILTVLWAMWKRNEPYRPGGNRTNEESINRAEVR